MTFHLYQKTRQPPLSPNAPILKKRYYFISSHDFSWKGLRSSDEDSHIVKIEKPNERNKKRESELPHRGSASRRGFSLFQAVGYLTGEMKECRNWLKGKQMSRKEAWARQKTTPSTTPPLALDKRSADGGGEGCRANPKLTPGRHNIPH